jgi:hypothetical protein
MATTPGSNCGSMNRRKMCKNPTQRCEGSTVRGCEGACWRCGVRSPGVRGCACGATSQGRRPAVRGCACGATGGARVHLRGEGARVRRPPVRGCACGATAQGRRPAVRGCACGATAQGPRPAVSGCAGGPTSQGCGRRTAAPRGSYPPWTTSGSAPSASDGPSRHPAPALSTLAPPARPSHPRTVAPPHPQQAPAHLAPSPRRTAGTHPRTLEPSHPFQG